MVFSTESFFERLRLARNGDNAALGELLDQYRPYLRLLAERAMDGRLAGRIDASDVVQQTFLSAVRKFEEFSGSDADALAGWLQLIHERNLIDTVRKHVQAERRSVGREVALTSDEPVEDVELTSPSQRLLRGESAVRLAQALMQLSADQSLAVRLRHLDGWPLEDIAKRMGRSTRAVAGLLHRGMEQLRERLSDQAGNPGCR